MVDKRSKFPAEREHQLHTTSYYLSLQIHLFPYKSSRLRIVIYNPCSVLKQASQSFPSEDARESTAQVSWADPIY